MASTYALPLGGNAHVKSSYESHIRSNSRPLRGDWIPPMNVPAGRKNPANDLLPHSHNHNHSDNHSHTHDSDEHTHTGHQTRYSVANGLSTTDVMKGRPRGESDLGRANGHAYSHSHSHVHNESKLYGSTSIAEESVNTASRFSPKEALTAILISLPFLLATFAYPLSATSTAGAQPSPFDQLKDAVTKGRGQEDTHTLHISEGSAFIQSCCLASGTLLLIGFLGSIYAPKQPSNQSKAAWGSGGGKSKTAPSSPSMVMRIIERALSIGLPFYASMHLGGSRTGLILLTTIASGLNAASPISRGQGQGFFSAWKKIALQRKLTCLVLLLGVAIDFSGLYGGHDNWSVIRGHLALALSIFIIPLPLSGSLSPFLGAHTTDSSQPAPSALLSATPSILSAEDTKLTLFSGMAMSIFTILAAIITSTSPSVSVSSLIFSSLSITSALGLVGLSSPVSLKTQPKYGLAIGYAITTLPSYFSSFDGWRGFVVLGVSSCISYAAVRFDTGAKGSKVAHNHNHKHHSHDHHGSYSRLTGLLLKRFPPGSIIHSVLSEKDSRRIAYFALLNLGFMLVQFFYGFVSGSLGLLTDSIHMLFDCLGLAVGLAAAVMSKWPPDSKFPYGYGKVDTLSGFANGIFLMLVSIEIVFDASERLMEGHELQRLNELLVVSVLGFLVNLVGLTAFGHAHHGHDHGHDHSHDNENMQGIFLHIMADALGSVAVIISTLLTKFYGWSGWDPIASCIIAILIFGSAIPLVKSSGMRLLLSLPADVEYGIRNALQEINTLRGVIGYSVPRFWLEDSGPAQGHSHDHHDHPHDHGCDGHVHEHSHDDHDNHHGSNDHSHSHSHSHAHAHDHSHSHSHSHTEMEPRAQSHSSHGHSHDEHSHDHPHEHAHGPQKVQGIIHIIAGRNADLEDVRQRTEVFLKERNLNVVVHVERDGDRCWCGGGASKMS